MANKDFDNERDALIFRNSKRQEGLAASIFNYGKDRYRIKVMELGDIHPERTQRFLSNSAWELSHDIEDLTKIKELIADPDFGCEIDGVVFVAKYLNKEHFFSSTSAVVSFFDGDFNLAKIKEIVDTSLAEYDEDWEEEY